MAGSRSEVEPNGELDRAVTLSPILGALYRSLGFPRESAALYQDALEARTAVHGERSLAVAETLLDLGLLEARLVRYEAAGDLARRSL